MELLHLTQIAGKHPHELSGEEKLRTALARALVVEPQILLLDEPLAGLDAAARQRLGQTLRELHQRHQSTFLLATADAELAMTASDRVAVLRAGHIEQVDTPDVLYERPRTRFVAEAVGACNLVQGEFRARSGQLLEAETSIGVLVMELSEIGIERAEQGKFIFGIRPERISLRGGGASDNRILGRITEVAFTGAMSRYVVRVGESIDLRVTEFNTGRRLVDYFVGDEVEVFLPPSNMFVLED